jgi:hypothetical protein
MPARLKDIASDLNLSVVTIFKVLRDPFFRQVAKGLSKQSCSSPNW